MPEERLYPTDSPTVTLSNGEPLPLRFTNGSLRRLKTKLGVKSNLELFGLEFSEIVGEMIWEGLGADKRGLTPEAIDDLIPVHKMADVQMALASAISGVSVEEIKKKQQPALPNPQQSIQ